MESSTCDAPNPPLKGLRGTHPCPRENLPHQEATEEVAAPPKQRCPHAHIIRRFAQMAEIRGCRMDDTKGRRDAFRKYLGRPLKSCSELTASEWEAGMIALREGRLHW